MALDLPRLDERPRCAEPKPMKGSTLLASKVTRKQRVTAEQKIMQQAVRLDGHKCRVNDCPYRDMPIDPCHWKTKHRGMGGNPKLDRTTLQTIFAGCRIHHGMYDRGEIGAKLMNKSLGTRGPIAFYHTRGGLKVLIGISLPGGK